MKRTGIRNLLCCAAMCSVFFQDSAAQAQNHAVAHGFDEFNHALADATRRLDNTATLALWEDDGISLLPSTAPIAGKPALKRFFDQATASLGAARMKLFEMQCFDGEIEGGTGSEWCDEHQVVVSEKGEVIFEGRGRMLLVLHRSADGPWRLRREMWIPAEQVPPRP